MTKKELLAKLKVLDLKDDKMTKKTVCALIGHSNIHDYWFGYHYCGRCGTQVGDSLSSYYRNQNVTGDYFGATLNGIQKFFLQFERRRLFHCLTPAHNSRLT